MASTEADHRSDPKVSEPRKPRRPNYNHIHRNPLPVEIYPLPTLIPHNPLSLLAIGLSYLSQLLLRPARPSYNGYFSSSTSSIHISDPRAIRSLWEMGFFGRGSLSRSEPTWQQSQARVGSTAEENTDSRRDERRKQKRVRAQKEQQEIANQLSEEALGDGGTLSNVLKTNETNLNGIDNVLESARHVRKDSIDNLEPLDDSSKPQVAGVSKLKSMATIIESTTDEQSSTLNPASDAGQIEGYDEWRNSVDANGLPTPPLTSASSESSIPEVKAPPPPARQKTVRFSPTIEAREFDLSSPVISPIKRPGFASSGTQRDGVSSPSENKEHLHISLEEAFFLSYSLGVLKIFCDDSDTVLPPMSLLSLFRRHSYHPPRSLSVPAEPNDPFMLSYVVYHHYRSLGWVVRSGVKFGVDYLLYNRGPAFSHADFAVVVIPSYANDETKRSVLLPNQGDPEKKRTWSWLHGVNRVQAQVYKQLVLCYVEVPTATRATDGRLDPDIGKLLSRYKVRDVNVKRWTPNRARD